MTETGIDALPLGHRSAQSATMRAIAIAVLLLPLAACSGGPQALGITGPHGASAATPASAGATRAPVDPLDNPNLLQSGGRYGPDYAPTTGSGRFWGYN